MFPACYPWLLWMLKVMWLLIKLLHFLGWWFW
jgi:hypothetical protein